MTIEAILRTTVRVRTFDGYRGLTNATGFFYERGQQLFLVTCRHVLIDAAQAHHPDRIEVEIHAGDDHSSRIVPLSIPLFENGLSLWRTCADAAGDVDVAAIEIPRGSLPGNAVYRAFTARELALPQEPIEVGQALLVVGFPLGFQDNLHHLPVVRQAAIASSFGLRFEGKGFFLTDARTHRGTSGAPVVMRVAGEISSGGNLPWRLLGVHSARLDMGSRDVELDEALGLNCAWYADVLWTLTGAPPEGDVQGPAGGRRF